MSRITFRLHQGKSVKPLEIEYQHLFAIGYAGRNMEKTRNHISELERELGVPAPKRIPTIFECSHLLLTQDEELQFVGGRTCGEAEYIILLCNGKIYIGVGSDHTDRELESQSVLKSKQICAKPIGSDIWDYDDLKDHWDSIRIRSFQQEGGVEIPYQDGRLADILQPEKILSELNERLGDIGNSVIFSGTVPVIDIFRFGEAFRCELVDDILSRSISCFYRVKVITGEER